ncbi:hypothetical protein V1281_004215 [Nitrobacteraceae bacterium AZCC 2161]
MVIARSFRQMPPKNPNAPKWVRPAGPAPAPVPPMRFIPSKPAEALTPEFVKALAEKYPETAADAICDEFDEVELSSDDAGYTQMPEEEEREPVNPADIYAPEPVRAAPVYDEPVEAELRPGVGGVNIPRVAFPPRKAVVPPTPPSSGLMSSRIGTLPVPPRRPPISVIPPRSPPATGRDT